MKTLTASLLSLAGVASAEVALWGQCGGTSYTGETTCVSGSTCQVSNQYYSQCVPGTSKSQNELRNTRSRGEGRRQAKSEADTAPGTATTLITTSTASPATTTVLTSTSTPIPTNTPGAAGDNPSAASSLFTIDGVTKYFAGTNAYWIGFLTNNADVDTALDDLVDAGLKILRVWGFNDVTSNPGSSTVYYQLLSSSGSTINTGANGLQRLDYVVQAAEARDIKLIVNFVNNWSDYGGMPAYVTAFGGTKEGWYTNTAAQTQYKAYIKAVVARYADSSAIFAWELANEPRCNGCATSVVTNWATTTSAYIKSLDPNHLVTMGDEGFGLPGDGSYPYTYGEGMDFVANLKIPDLDFGTFHLYPDSWGTTNDWGNAWITSHGAACAAAGKPCLFEEYGTTSDHCSIESPWQATALSANGISADLFWQLGTTLSTGQTSNDGNTLYVGTSDWTCLVTNHVAAIG
ncbi:Uu.00g031040.m01.CDS01 [Anthostomella pinea]|uniref:Mannan endo-1,4-beta-mannosidase A n=1 Tax=Anthostomella pinea TaxID=933095 RepID=A0AAI8YCY6_9PEZI|nr:Uu.00g031040.m01.CDS01 [Anthostomella pinea]